MAPTVGRVFMNGNSQAVRIPKAFRLETNRVHIFRNAEGDLVLRPSKSPEKRRGDALLKALAAFDDDFAESLEAFRRDPEPMQEREPL